MTWDGMILDGVFDEHCVQSRVIRDATEKQTACSPSSASQMSKQMLQTANKSQRRAELMLRLAHLPSIIPHRIVVLSKLFLLNLRHANRSYDHWRPNGIFSVKLGASDSILPSGTA